MNSGVEGIPVESRPRGSQGTAHHHRRPLLGDQLNASLSDPGALHSWKAPPPGGASPGPGRTGSDTPTNTFRSHHRPALWTGATPH